MTAWLDDAADPWRSARLAILAVASAGDAGAVYHLVTDLMGDGVAFPTILFEVLSPLEAEVGSRWQQGDFCIADEHLVTATLETVVSLLAGSFDVPDDARRVVVACAEGDTHSLPARMVAAYLVFLGWRSVFLGAGQPASDLGAFLHEQPPEALILACAMATALPGARECIRVAHEAGVPVLVGGRGFGPDGRRAYALGADAWTADPGEIDVVLNNWRPDPAAAEAKAPHGGEDLLRLEERRAGVVARALALLGEQPGDRANPAQFRPDLELLLDALAASLLLDDAQVVTELAAWQRSRPAAAGEARATALLAALRAALGTDPSRGAAFLEAAVG